MNNKKKITYIDLFSGAGGFSLGFDNAGFENIFSIHIKGEFAKTYQHNFPSHNLVVKDICELTEKEILELTKGQEVDVIIGGPPCQGFSMAGNIGRKFTEDPRNSLFKEFARVIDVVKPKTFVMENVARLYTHNNGETRKEIFQIFQKMGYRVQCEILNSSHYGVPQIRKRIIFIGTRLDGEIVFPKKDTKNIKTVKDAIGHFPSLSSGQKSNVLNHIAMNHSAQMLAKMAFVKDGGDRKDIPQNIRPKSGDARKYIRYKSDAPSVCITGDMRKVFHYSQNRALTVRELASIQSYPDTFEFLGSSIAQQQQIGNSVPPLMALAIANAVKEMLK